MVIDKLRWQQAQLAERKLHTEPMNEAVKHYGESYHWNFHYLGIEPDQKGKTIVEIGPADVPALYFCDNVKGMVVEPMPSVTLDVLCKDKGIMRMSDPVEEIDIPPCDEIWFFNVMQHIINPDLFIEKCKAAANVIRFFEPIDCGICEHHPHSYTAQDFISYFGAVKIYNDKRNNFHDGPCVYGVWRKLNQPYIVGERGPDLFTPQRSANA